MTALKRAAWMILSLAPIELCFRGCQRAAFFFAKLSRMREAGSGSAQAGSPRLQRHELNIYSWLFDPAEGSFCLRAAHARAFMTSGSKVLDLCSGDGSYGFLFYSDIASSVDSVDVDSRSVAYSQARFKRHNVRNLRLDIVKDELPADDYDWIVFNAGMYYLTAAELDAFLGKLVRTMRKPFGLVGSVPVSTGHSEHKFEFKSRAELEAVLGRFFNDVSTQDVNEGFRSNYYFVAQGPRR